ncbi:pyruvate formate lyase-activating protein [Prevotella intermedia]|uniref:Pyruvate formate lyase-activating protein n=1 Tax=Prevotella intermedia TaxID=28131 RepID=A0AAJ3RT17_PREIN|nr:radical SAM protein [Prevotella intermedia]PJI19793.1 pyruvate formate lyase-activating protein [Prevotella intermedia]
MQEVKAPIIGINRHRLTTDGEGVTTLVAFHGCPLHCKYCLNPQCFSPDGVLRTITPSELYSEVEIDDLYFMATGGGICFGGGEPLLHSKFIVEFAKIMNPEWNIVLETSLNVPLKQLEMVAPLVKEFVVDVKDMDEQTYKAYTTQGNVLVTNNLKWLAENGYAAKTLIRLPLIPYYNTEAAQKESRKQIKNMGFHRFDKFEYIVKQM